MNTDRPAFFIGIALPEELSKRISSFKWKLYDDIDYALKPLVPHITLLHPSSLQSSLPEELLPKIRAAAASYLPLTLSLGGIEAFGDTVLYIRVRSSQLETLQSELVTLLPLKAQEVYHQRGYQPHITLAQVRDPHTLDIEDLRRRTTKELIFPDLVTINSLSCFTQIQPREYRPLSI